MRSAPQQRDEQGGQASQRQALLPPLAGTLLTAALLPPLLPPPAALAASLLGLAPLRPPPSAEVAIKKLLPVAASFAASLFLGNVAYLGLSGEGNCGRMCCSGMAAARQRC